MAKNKPTAPETGNDSAVEETGAVVPEEETGNETAAKEEAAPKAEKKAQKTVPAREAPKMVKITVPLAREDEQDLIIGINGKNWAIPQDGREHEVPDYVAYEYARSKAAERKFFQKQNELVKQSQIV